MHRSTVTAPAPYGRSEISALASNVVSLLNGGPPMPAAGLLDSATGYLYAAVRTPRGFVADATLAHLRGLANDDRAIVDTCIPEVARRLGRDWTDDAASFAEVSVATARLQGLLPLLAMPTVTSPASIAPEDRTALIVLPPAETHTLGVHVVAAQLRRTGVSARIAYGPGADELCALAAQDEPDIVLFSCARTERVDHVTVLVSALRKETRCRALCVLGGSVLDRLDGLGARTGVDLVTNDVQAGLTMHGATARNAVRRP